jgi:16S rRNA (adenine1518-N6/adenine1519-N6)-dimethyltransferase|uniref:16S rRNA (adenine(1518)-N(6)/adenine(1519)-N(6))- dimethyltransferase RsmA n=2 Tax=Cephaloticoccus sp. TaxID=1985742 RepID=UPI004049F168
MPLSPSDTRELLTSLGHAPRRHLGQNFLVDGNIVRKSVELAEVSSADTVVEIGPGLGTLTSALLDTGADIWAIERDPKLYAYLRAEITGPELERFHLSEGDAVDHALAMLPAEKTEFKIVANLPYAISTPWMDSVLSGPLPARMVLMLQLEAAERYAANPGSKIFGAISIFLQSAYAIAPGHRVGSSCFYPRPEVDSALLHLVRRAQPFVFPAAVKILIRGCFQQRRKQIGSLLRGRLPDDGAKWLAHLSNAGFSHQSRPEQIPVTLWQELTLDSSLS